MALSTLRPQKLPRLMMGLDSSEMYGYWRAERTSNKGFDYVRIVDTRPAKHPYASIPLKMLPTVKAKIADWLQYVENWQHGIAMATQHCSDDSMKPLEEYCQEQGFFTDVLAQPNDDVVVKYEGLEESG